MQTLITMGSYFTPVVMGFILFKIQKLSNKTDEKNEQDKKEQAALRDGVCSLLRVNLIEYHKEYTTKGYISSRAFENFMLMYTSYHALGGNGMIDQMHNEIKELPLK